MNNEETKAVHFEPAPIPCPFCGATFTWCVEGNYKLHHKPGCWLSMIHDNGWLCGGKIIAAWNRRTPSPAVARIMEATRAMLTRLHENDYGPEWDELQAALKAVEEAHHA